MLLARGEKKELFLTTEHSVLNKSLLSEDILPEPIFGKENIQPQPSSHPVPLPSSGEAEKHMKSTVQGTSHQKSETSLETVEHSSPWHLTAKHPSK